jgi:hypothetical protein
MLNVAWLNFIISVLYAYLLVDKTVIAAGDFVWSAEMGAFLLHVVSVLFLFKHYASLANTETVTTHAKIILTLCAVVFVLHVISGVSWYTVHLTGNDIDLLYGIW